MTTEDVKKKAVAAQKPADSPKDPEPSSKAYSIAEFSQMTYLTDFGVEDFLKKGRLNGASGDNDIINPDDLDW